MCVCLFEIVVKVGRLSRSCQPESTYFLRWQPQHVSSETLARPICTGSIVGTPSPPLLIITLLLLLLLRLLFRPSLHSFRDGASRNGQLALHRRGRFPTAQGGGGDVDEEWRLRTMLCHAHRWRSSASAIDTGVGDGGGEEAIR